MVVVTLALLRDVVLNEFHVLSWQLFFIVFQTSVLFTFNVYRTRRGDRLLAQKYQAAWKMSLRAGRRVHELSPAELVYVVSLFGINVTCVGPRSSLHAALRWQAFEQIWNGGVCGEGG